MIQPTSSNNTDEEQVLSGSPVNQQSSSAYVGSATGPLGTGEVFSEPPTGVGVEITPDQQREIDAQMDSWDKLNTPEDALYEHFTTNA